MIVTEKFTLCEECACEVVNADFTGRDFSDLSEDNRASRDASIEVMGIVVLAEIHSNGYFTCFVCDEVSAGDANIFESIT